MKTINDHYIPFEELSDRVSMQILTRQQTKELSQNQHLLNLNDSSGSEQFDLPDKVDLSPRPTGGSI